MGGVDVALEFHLVSTTTGLRDPGSHMLRGSYILVTIWRGSSAAKVAGQSRHNMKVWAFM